MSEGVKILISADDQASKVLANVATNVDAKVKQIKTVGQGAKASTEFIGTLANSLGGSLVGSYAAGIAQLTERISAFSEVSKAGAGGALAFKAGLAGVALVAGFKIGTMIGNWAFETERWNKELEKANESLLKSAALAARTTEIGLSIKTEKIEQTEDPAERAKLLKQYQTELSKEAEKTANELAKQTKELEEQRTWYQRNIHISKEQLDADEADLALTKEKLATIEKEQEVVRNKLRSDVLELEALKESNALKKRNTEHIKGLEDEVTLLKASTAEHAALAAAQKGGAGDDALKATRERIAIEASQKAGGDVAAKGRIESLLREKDAILAKEEARKKSDAEDLKAKEDQQRKAERLADLKKNELAKLEEQRILLTQGKEAAHAFALEQQGLDKATASKIAAEKEKLDKLSNDKPQESLQSVQGRLLTRGPSDDIRKRQLDAALKLVDVLQRVESNTQPYKNKFQLEVIGSK